MSLSISKAAGKRIAVEIMNCGVQFSYNQLLKIIDDEEVRVSQVPELMRHFVDNDRQWEMFMVAKVCANEAADNRTILKALNYALNDLNSHFE